MEIKIKYIPKIYDFFEDNPDARIYVIAGGRGKGATWAIGNEILVRSFQRKHFVICTREIKDTVDHSSRRTIERLITGAGLRDYFQFQKTCTINRVTGTEIIYTGLSKITEDNVQGLEGVTMAWLAEAHAIERSSWQKFEPTIREEGAVIFVDYNVRHAVTPIHAMFTEDPGPTGWPFVGKKNVSGLAYLFLTYHDNTLIPRQLLDTAERNRAQYSAADWAWIWEGKLKDSTDRFIADVSLVEAAMAREVPVPRYGTTWIGADIAHLGGDEIVFYKRKGPTVTGVEVFDRARATETLARLEAFAGDRRESVINIDNGYIGAAVADELEARGWKVNRINFGGRDLFFDPDHSADTVTDMAFNLVEALKTASIPRDDVLKNQICQRRWDFVNEKGIRKIESKDQFRAHASGLEGHASPDRFDALALAYYEPIAPGVIGLGNLL